MTTAVFRFYPLLLFSSMSLFSSLSELQKLPFRSYSGQTRLQCLVLLSREHSYNTRRTELLKEVSSFLPPNLQNKHLDCCTRRNLNLGGGARERSDEASRLCCLVPVRLFPSPSRSIVSMTYPRRKGGERLTFSHGPRDRKRFGHEKKWGLGTRQETLLSIFYAAPHWKAHPAKYVCRLS